MTFENMEGSLSRQLIGRSCALVVGILSLTALEFPTRLRAQSSSTDWSVNVLDKILVKVQPDQKVAQLGDMQILVSNLRTWRNYLAGGFTPESAFGGSAPIWTGGTVYYTFTNTISAAHRTAFVDAATEWAMFSNLHFVQRTTENNYVMVIENGSLNGGRSALGMVGGAQLLEIGPSSWNRYVLCHEIGHALGLIHEHQRSDRDLFVTVLTGNIIPEYEPDFAKLTNSRNHSGYDFLSIMHYARNAWSINLATLNTLEPLPGYKQYLDMMGQNESQRFGPILSAADRAGIAEVYGPGPLLSSVVSNTQDGGVGSLRAALYYSLDHSGTTITFNIPTSDPGFVGKVFRIQPTDQLPSVANSTTLDGSTEPVHSNSSGPSILLNGALAPPPDVSPNGLHLRGSNCVVRSLIINGFASSGVLIDGTSATGNVVSGCFLGIDPSGTVAVPNGSSPVSIVNGAHDNTIGTGNVISGSTVQGIVLRDPGTSRNKVQGNYIGLNAAGTSAVSNAWAGVAIFGAAGSNIVGGAQANMRNVISGNGTQGILISDVGTSANVVQGNYIGLNPSGTAAVPNANAGVLIIGGATGNAIGGPLVAAANVISGNGWQGVSVYGQGTKNNTIAGNLIGLNPAGTVALGNGTTGVAVFGGAQSNILGGDSVAFRNIISGNRNQGVVIADPTTSDNFVQGNYIGLNVGGTSAVSNAWAGVAIFGTATSNIIGGTQAGMRNVISGNGTQGILIDDAGTRANLVQGNYVGLNPSGTAAVPNGASGVEIFGAASSNVIGGVLTGARNVISGNANHGVLIVDSGTIGNTVQGNVIGLNAAGSIAIENTWSGVTIAYGSQANLVGGGGGARNVISGNGNNGVWLTGTNTTANIIEGNTIGLNTANNAAAPNKFIGISVSDGAHANRVGGITLAAANLIASNLSIGVWLSGTNTSNNPIRANSIFGNAGLGIGLNAGANRSAASPSLTAAVVTTNTTVTGTLSSRANSTFHLDFYANSPPAAQAQGKAYLGAHDVTTSGSGTASFSVPLAAAVPLNEIITATATDLAGNTSQFSGGVPVTGIDSVGDGVPDAWRRAHFGGAGTTTNFQSCAHCDPDRDQMDNRQEFLAGTDPNNAGSRLRITSIIESGNAVLINFQSANGVVYQIEDQSDLALGAWSVLVDQILGNGGIIAVADPSAGSAPRKFYRVAATP